MPHSLDWHCKGDKDPELRAARQAYIAALAACEAACQGSMVSVAHLAPKLVALSEACVALAEVCSSRE